MIAEMRAATHLSQVALYNIGIEVLHSVWATLRNGGEIGVKSPEGKNYVPVVFMIPGMHKGRGLV
jgi:hypothetical protein